MTSFNRSAGRAASFGILLLAGAAAGEPLLDVSRTHISFGRDAARVEFVQPLFLTNIGDGPVTFSGFPITGQNYLEYRVGGPCSVTPELVPGGRCRLDVIGALTPPSSSATLTIESDSVAGPVTVGLHGTPSDDIARGPFATPPWIDFDHQPLGTTSAPLILTLTNPEPFPLILDSVEIHGKNAADFFMTSDCVVGRSYVKREGCSTTIAFSPGASGPRATEITFVGHVKNTAPAT